MRHSGVALLLAVASCGPGRVPFEAGDDGSSSTGATSATSSTSSTTTTASGATSSSTSTSTSGTTSGTGSSSGNAFIRPCDCPTPIECDTWLQDCPDGEKCTIWTDEEAGGVWNATKCVPVDRQPGGMYDPCQIEGDYTSGIDDCGVGLFCYPQNTQTGEGLCFGMCEGDAWAPACSDPNAFCGIYADGIFTLCYPRCDPLVQDCPAGEVCVPHSHFGEFVCDADASGDTGVHGDPCEYIAACDPGLFCSNADGVSGCAGNTGCCAQFCDVTDPLGNDQCPGVAGGEECVPWYEAGMAPPGLEDVGACVIPP